MLERAGLVHVVRTRRVRARDGEVLRPRGAALPLQERDESDDELVHGIGAMSLRAAAAEVAAAPEVAMHALLRVRLSPAAAKRFNRRLDKLVDDMRAAERRREYWGLVAGLYRSARP